uniref:Peptidase S10 serine carboxypeptidase n=1 Tax=Caulobacter sp. (strain K31) TaxID=366602 RepID=B0T926_CAUSK
MAYRAFVDQIVLSDPATGRPQGQITFTAYRVAAKGPPRPIAFIWNGGPGAPSTLLHFQAFGPKRLEDGRLSDNGDTLLDRMDLVFVDPIGTGFSRAVSPEAAIGFYGTRGDFEATARFVRQWRAQYADPRAAVFLVGESFGVWRAAGAAELLAKAGQAPAGLVLISGGAGVGAAGDPPALAAALRVPGRAAAALHHRRSDPALGADRASLVAAAEAWARATYAPALENVARLDPQARQAVARDLARFTGYPLERIDQTTLALTARQYREGLLLDQGRTLYTFDMRLTAAPKDEADGSLVESYYRTALGYGGPGPYLGMADPPAAGEATINSRWRYDSAGPPRGQAGDGPPGAEPWTLRALAIAPRLKVLVATGLYDSLNSCAAMGDLAQRLEPAQAGAFTFHCYAGGHMMYADAPLRAQLSADVKAFVGQAIGPRP